MPMAYIRPMGESGLYHVHFVSAVDPGYGHGGGMHPDQGLPSYGRPDQGLPGYGHPDQGLPGMPPRPGQGLPSNPNFPNNTLPSGPPPHIQPGATLVLVRDPAGVWHYAAINPGQPVPPPLPTPPMAPGAAPKG